VPISWLSFLFVVILAHSICFVDVPRNAPRLESTQTPWGNSSFSSDLQLSMFTETVEDFDYKTAKRRKVDANAFMKMVSSSTIYYTTVCINHRIADPFVHRIYMRGIRSICPLPQTRSPRYFHILSRNYIPTGRRPLRFHYIHRFHSQQTSGFVRGPPRQPCFYPEPYSCPGANVGAIGWS
jgi:hypothetical protein